MGRGAGPNGIGGEREEWVRWKNGEIMREGEGNGGKIERKNEGKMRGKMKNQWEMGWWSVVRSMGGEKRSDWGVGREERGERKEK